MCWGPTVCQKLCLCLEIKQTCSLTRSLAPYLADGGGKITGLNLKDLVLTLILPGSLTVAVNKSPNLAGLHFSHLSNFNFKYFK